ncbi:MAG TPA: amidase [Thermomicrobiales bacterium]|nr:amidase [Thermomicrobiales bacterium]
MIDATSATRSSLAEIQRTEPLVRAWVHVAADTALAQATEIDDRAGKTPMPLAGLTVGVKDIVDVAGMPTMAGFEPFANRIAERDSAVAAGLRAAGATILGKTTTTQFAVADPTVTRNPWNLERSPAGSSSGSAAAVAAGHVDLAIGSQTAGSTLRPAAFCGVVGFKPSFGWTSRAGMIPLSDTLDTVGLFSRTVTHAALLFDVLAAEGIERAGECEAEAPARIGFWSDAAQLATDDVAHLIEAALTRAIQAGAVVEDAVPPAHYRDLLAIHHITMLVDAAAAHEKQFRQRPESYHPRVRSLIETGMAIPAHAYVRAQILRREYREKALANWATVDVIALPTAETSAVGLEWTGSPALQAVVTLFGLPAISLPAGLSPDGLPVGIQLVATTALGNARLLRIARWMEALLDPLPAIPTGINPDIDTDAGH